MKGWILIYRSIKNNWVWEDKPFSKGQAFIDLLLNANHAIKSVYFRDSVYHIQRGSFITSEIKLSEDWGWSRTKTRSFLLRLEKEKMILQNKDNRKTIITIIKYDSYQSPGISKNTTAHTREKHHEIQQQDINKKENNKKNKNEILYRDFLKIFNSTTNTKFNGDNISKRQFFELISDYSLEDFDKAISNGFEASKKWTNPVCFTPKYITREDKFELYLADSWPASKQKNKELLSLEQVESFVSKYFGKVTPFFMKTLKNTTVDDFLWLKIIKSEAAAEYLIGELHKTTGGDLSTAIAVLNKTLKGN